jgi:hypothetical protein
MAITKVFATGKDFEFGVKLSTGGSSCAGIDTIVSAELTANFDTNVTAKDEDGDVVAHAFGNKKSSGSIEGYATTDATLPGVGGPMVVRGVSMKIMNVTITASNEDFLMVKVDGEGYDGLTYL